MRNRNVFLNGEADNWFHRNESKIDLIDFSLDRVVKKVSEFIPNKNTSILEIGCANAKRLTYLFNQGYEVFGIEPSSSAVNKAQDLGFEVIRGTADKLDYIDQKFDCVIFGFCLYLVDPVDYFKVLSESYRVLKDGGVIIIHDFAPRHFYKKEYHHADGVITYKFEHNNLFLAHPHFHLLSSEKYAHSNNESDMKKQDEWCHVSVLRKQIDLFQ